MRADTDIDAMKLSIENLNQLQLEFTSIFEDMVEQAQTTVRRAWEIKLESLNKCETEINRRQNIKK